MSMIRKRLALCLPPLVGLCYAGRCGAGEPILMATWLRTPEFRIPFDIPVESSPTPRAHRALPFLPAHAVSPRRDPAFVFAGPMGDVDREEHNSPDGARAALRGGVAFPFGPGAAFFENRDDDRLDPRVLTLWPATPRGPPAA